MEINTRERLKVQPVADRKEPGYFAFKTRDERNRTWLNTPIDLVSIVDFYA